MTHRWIAAAGIAAAAFLAGSLAGCGSGTAPGLGVNNALFATVDRVASPGAVFFEPASSVPDAADQFIYFVASGASGRGVFKVPSAGGAVTAVFVGAPFVRPIDLVLSTDSQTLYVADSLAGGTGRIYSLPVGGGAPAEVAGTAGTAPVALDVIAQSGQDRLYFCGSHPADGQPAVFEIPAAGAGSATPRYKGAPLVSPAGIVSARDGTLLIADQGALPNQGAIRRLSGATISEVARGLFLGSPPGIALTPDDRTVAVSTRNAETGAAQVFTVDLQTGAQSLFNKVIGANSRPGGLHGARNASGATGVYSWVDLTGGIHRLRG